MTRADQVRARYDSTLKPRIDALEGVRRALKAYVVKSLIVVGVPFAVFFVAGNLFGQTAESIIAPLAFLTIFVAIALAAKMYRIPGATAFLNYRARFKRDVVNEIFKIVVPDATYDAYHGIPADVFDEAGVFARRGGYSSEDRVRGRIGSTPFEAAEARRTYTTGTGNRKRRHVVFQGLFFHRDFNKTLRGTTIVEPERTGAAEQGDRDHLELVSVEKPRVRT